MKTFTEGDMFRAWTEGWHAGFKDHRSLATELTPNPYGQKKEDRDGLAKVTATVSED